MSDQPAARPAGRRPLDRPFDRPRYRVVATAMFTHGDHNKLAGGGHTLACVNGWLLELYRVDAGWRHAVGERAHAPMTTQPLTLLTNAADRTAIRNKAMRWLRDASRPKYTSVYGDDVTVYIEMLD